MSQFNFSLENLFYNEMQNRFFILHFDYKLGASIDYWLYNQYNLNRNVKKEGENMFTLENAESLAGVHTHTHTHTQVMLQEI